ncbi:hypothetical protein ACLK2B_15895 [Escherichia coli]
MPLPSGLQGTETYGNCSTLEFCDVGGGIWPVGIGHPCYGCNEQGVGFGQGNLQLAKVENPTPRVDKPDVKIRRGAVPRPPPRVSSGGPSGCW